MSKLRNVKACLKKWNVDVFGDIRVEKRNLMGRLETLDRLENSSDWNDSLKEERSVIKSKLQELILKEERTLRQKSKFRWAKEGDANSKVFHKLMNARKSRNFISRL